MKDIFISYSRKDSEKVNHFVDILTKEGYTVWIDKDGIESGDQFKLVIVKAIEESRLVLFFSSESSNASTWTAKEIGIANARQKPIIPIKLDQSSYNRQVEFDLINNDFVDFSGGLDNEHALRKLLKSIAKKCNPEQEENIASGEVHTQQRPHISRSKWIIVAIAAAVIIAAVSVVILRPGNSSVELEAEELTDSTAVQPAPKDQVSTIVAEQTSAASEAPKQMTQAPEPKINANKEYKMGLDLFTGNGVDMDYEEASKHLLKAADAGNAEAQYVIGRMYYHGIVTHDYSKAVKYFKKSASQGNASAAYYLSTCYLHGLGAPQDDAKMLEYLTFAADKGGFQARADLCSYYLSGFHVEKNIELAEKYYKLAKQEDSFNLSTLKGIDEDYYFKLSQSSLEDKWKDIQKEKNVN